MRSFFRLMALIVIILSLYSCAIASGQDSIVVATINGSPVTQNQIDYEVKKFIGNTRLSPDQIKRAKKSILEKLINQRVTIDFLTQHKLAAAQSEIRLKVEELKNELAVVGKTLEDFLETTGQTQPELEFQFSLEIGWGRYLELKFTDDFLEDYFKQHRREFDGTELRVAHLLLKVEFDAANEKRQLTLDKARQLKARLDASEPWDELVKENSHAPTRESGGEIGWIKRGGPMPVGFTEVAFGLAKDQVSKPVTTKFGIHLIKCLEVKQGKVGWSDTREAVEKSAEGALFRAICEQHRPKLKIEYVIAN